MAVLMTAFTPLQVLGLLNLADDLLEREPDVEIDLIIDVGRPGMAPVATFARQAGVFRHVWAPPFGSPGHLRSCFRLKYPSVAAALRYFLAAFLRTLGCARKARQRLHNDAFCPGMLDSRYDAIYQPMWSKDCELYAHFSRKNPVVRHLIDEGFATWRQFEEDAPFPCDVAHLYEPRLISDRHSEVRILRMPEITPERVRLFGWLDSAFPLTESEHPPKVEGVAGPASSVLFDQNFGSGMYRSDHPSSKTVRLWESRKAVLEGAENMVNAVGGTLVVRAHPYSSDREILDLEALEILILIYLEL